MSNDLFAVGQAALAAQAFRGPNRTACAVVDWRHE